MNRDRFTKASLEEVAAKLRGVRFRGKLDLVLRGDFLHCRLHFDGRVRRVRVDLANACLAHFPVDHVTREITAWLHMSDAMVVADDCYTITIEGTKETN